MEKFEFGSYRKYFTFHITKEYREKYGTLFPDGKLPKLLPQPNGYYYTGLSSPCIFPHFSENLPENQNDNCYSHVWTSADKNRSISLTNSGRISITANGSPQVKSGIVNAKNEPCRALKPCENIDDLLYQMYINLDSGCLFKMPIAELETAWKTKIAFYKKSDGIALKFVAPKGVYLDEKPYKTERDAFFIEAVLNDDLNIENFIIKKTREYDSKGETLLLNDSDYPKGLPEPFKTSSGNTPPMCSVNFPCPDTRLGKYSDNTFYIYYWLNSNKTRMIGLIGSFGKVSSIESHDYIPQFYVADINKR